MDDAMANQQDTYNRTAIMTHTWEIVRKANVAKFGLRFILARALKAAWSEAKHAVAMAGLC